MKNIVLIGFMGTGKSVVGKRLAKELNRQFVSTDDIIAEKEKRPIAEIFAKSGEPYFRQVERQAVKEASRLDGAVIAAGGGVVLNEENMANLRENGDIVCLAASPQEIYERTKKYKTRPLLNVADPVAAINELVRSRAPFYAKADHQVDTTGKTVKQVVREIKRLAGA